MTPRTLRRDLIVRIDGRVRFARLADTALADAIWERIPHYGVLERSRDGTVATGFDVAVDAMLSDAQAAFNTRSLYYCLLTRRIVFPSPAITTASSALAVWGYLVDGLCAYALDTVPNGARLSLLHADS